MASSGLGSAQPKWDEKDMFEFKNSAVEKHNAVGIDLATQEAFNDYQHSKEALQFTSDVAYGRGPRLTHKYSRIAD
jgi:hypothetical protein